MSVGPADARTTRPAHDGHVHNSRLQAVVVGLLLTGLVVAVALMVAGAVLAAAGHDVTVVRETPINDIPRALAALEPAGFFNLGILVLLASPVARVVALLVAYARHKRWLFCGLSLVVLTILAFSAFLGIRSV
jgi:uncharacterized membrane protein